MGVHIFSEWHSQLDQGGSGFCHYFLSDVILEDLETVRRKAVIFLHGLKHRYTPTDSPLTVNFACMRCSDMCGSCLYQCS